MAEADEEQWDVNEENLLLGSEMMVNDDHFDQETSSASSYTASVTNSPLTQTEAQRRADPHLEQ